LQTKDEKYFIHNHLSFTVKYHRDDNSGLSRIVGFEVNPHRFTSNFVWRDFILLVLYEMDLRYFGTYFASIKHQVDDKWNGVDTRLSTCDPHASKFVINSDNPQEVETDKEIIFTYDVRFEVRD